MPSTSARIPQLDGLRGVAIACVFVHHMLGVPLLWGGVDLFFVLSGFLITGILVNDRALPFPAYLRRFYARRARRLLPAYVIALALTAAVFGTWWLRWWPLYLGAMNFLKPLHLLSINTLPLWSLALEEQFYLVWPLACFFLSRGALLRLAAALVVLAPVLRVLCTPMFHLHWAIYMLLPFRMDTLAAGAVLALVWPGVQARLTATLRNRLLGGSAAAGLLALAVLLWLNRHGYDTAGNTRLANFAIYECILALAVAAFVVTLAGFGRDVLGSPVPVWLGRISYSIYLSHVGFIVLCRPGHHWALAVLGTLAYSAAMWFLVEAPILRHGRRPPPALLSA